MTANEFHAALGELGLSQAGLARELSEPGSPPVNTTTVWRWAHGRRAVPSGVAAYLRLRLENKRGRQRRLEAQ